MTNPQIGRIARLLGVSPDEVHGLDHLEDDDLRRLHDAISAAIFARYEQRFARIAGLSKALPGAVVGKLAERFLPPTLGARCAEMLEPGKARELVSKVSVRYLADLTLSLNPARSEPVVRAIPAVHIGPVARELFGRGEYAAMAEFAGTVNRDALEAALDVATAHDLLSIVPLLVWNDTIDEVVDHLPDSKVADLVRDIVASERWEEAGRMIERLHPAKATDLVGRIAPDVIARLVADLDPAHLGAVVAVVPPELVDGIVAGLPDDRIDAVLRAVVELGSWAEAEALLEGLPAAVLDRALDRADAVGDELMAELHAAAARDELGPAALELLDRAERRRAAR